MIFRLSRARLRRDREDGAFEYLRKASSAGPKPDGMEDSTVELFETIAERYEDLSNIGLER